VINTKVIHFTGAASAVEHVGFFHLIKKKQTARETSYLLVFTAIIYLL